MGDDWGKGWKWLSLALLALLLAYPFVANMTAITDDVSMFRTLAYPGLGERLLAAWKNLLFRPLYPATADLLDPVTRSSALLGLLHLGLAAGAIPALEALAAHLFERPLPRFCATALFLLHPATVVSLWQADTLSQTASATCGIWMVALAAGAVNVSGVSLCWLALTLLGFLTKETFVGWILISICLALLGRTRTGLIVFRRQRSSGVPLWAVLGALGLGIAFVAARLYVVSQHTSPTLAVDPEQRYSLLLDPLILARNITQLGAGLLMYGPLHAVHLFGVRNLSFWIGVAGLMLHAGVLVLAMRRQNPDRLNMALLWVLAMGSLGPVIPMGHVSELYLMGPNMLTALAFARGLTFVREANTRVQTSLLLGSLMICAALGQVSRGYQFWLSYRYAESLLVQVRDIEGLSVAQVGQPCTVDGLRHSVYVVPPLMALNPGATERFALDRGRQLPADWRQRLDCAALPPRLEW